MSETDDQLAQQKIKLEIAKLDLELIEMRKSRWRRVAISTKVFFSSVVGAASLYYGLTTARDAKAESDKAKAEAATAKTEAVTAKAEVTTAKTEAVTAKTEAAIAKTEAVAAKAEVALARNNLEKTRETAAEAAKQADKLEQEREKLKADRDAMAEEVKLKKDELLTVEKKLADARKLSADQDQAYANLNKVHEEKQRLLAQLAVAPAASSPASQSAHEHALADSIKMISATIVVEVGQNKGRFLPEPLKGYAIHLGSVSSSKAKGFVVFKLPADLGRRTVDELWASRSSAENAEFERELITGENFEATIGSRSFLIKPTILSGPGKDSVQFILEPR